MKKSYQNFQLTKGPEIKSFSLGSVLHATQGLHSTPQQLNNINIDCVIDCIPKHPTQISNSFDKIKRVNVTVFSVFCLVLLIKNTYCNINKAWVNDQGRYPSSSDLQKTIQSKLKPSKLEFLLDARLG